MITSPRNTSLSHPTPPAQTAPQVNNPATPPPKSEPIDMTTVLVTLIGALATIIAAFFASPIIENLSYDQPPSLSETEVIVHVADHAGRGVDGAKVSLFFESGQFNKWTYSNGSVKFMVPLPDGAEELDVSMTIEHDEYQIYNRQFQIPQEKLVEIRLNKKNKHSAKVIMRVVDDKSGLPVAGKNILLLVQGDTYNQITDSNGIAEFVLPFPEGKIDAKISITPPDYEAQYQHVTLLPNKVQDLRLSGKESAEVADLENENKFIPTLTPVYVVVSTPEVVSVPVSPTAAAPATVAPVGGSSVPASPTPVAAVAAAPAIVTPPVTLGGLSTPVAEEAELKSASIDADSTEKEPNTAPTSNRPPNVVPTESKVVASSTPVPVLTKENATNTPTTTKKPATSTATATVRAIPTKESATKTAIATNTKEPSTNTPTATVIEPTATPTTVPTATPVPPTETPTAITVTVTIAPTSEANEDPVQENEAEVNIVAEEVTAEPTEEVLATTEPTATPAATATPIATATALPAVTATATIATVETDESEVIIVAEEEAEEQPTLVEEEESVEEAVVEDEAEAILVVDPYPYPAPEAYP